MSEPGLFVNVNKFQQGCDLFVCGAGIVAIQAKLDAPLVSTMIGIGIPLGLSTTPAWHWIFGALVA